MLVNIRIKKNRNIFSEQLKKVYKITKMLGILVHKESTNQPISKEKKEDMF